MEVSDNLKELAGHLTPPEVEAVKRLREWRDATGSDSIHLREITQQFPDGMTTSITDTIARLENYEVLVRRDGGSMRVHRNPQTETYCNPKGKKFNALFSAELISNDPTNNHEFVITSRLVTLLDILAGDPSSTTPDTAHSIDFASVHWYGTLHSFTATQSACVRVLWEAWENKTPVVGEEAILEFAGDINSPLRNLFQGHKAWTTMITSAGKGRFRLTEPAG